MLERTLTVALLLGVLARASAVDPSFPPSEFHTVIKAAEHSISVTITSKKFDRSKHELMIAPSGDQTVLGHPEIDGRHPIGVDGYGIPEEEIDRFEVAWNGVPVLIEREIYADCYTPVLCRPNPADTFIGNDQTDHKIGNIRVRPNDAGDSILIIMRSFRWASAPYTVYWLIRRDGKHTRFIEGHST